MNLNELNSLTDNEIIDSIARTAGTPFEKALQAELTRRHSAAINSLNENISNLNSKFERLIQLLEQNPKI